MPAGQDCYEGEDKLIRIALVDDDAEFHALFSKNIRHFFHKNNILHELRLYSSPETLRYDLKEGRKSDLYFLDMEMPLRNGFELAKLVRLESPASMLVFLTSHLEYAVDGYELQAFGCISKNLLDEEIDAILERFLAEMHKLAGMAYLIDTGTRFERVEYEDIVYMYKDKKNTVFILTDRQIAIRKSLREIFDELDTDCFMYIERGYVVNMEHIIRLADKELELGNGTTLPIGRTYIKKVKRQWCHFGKTGYERTASCPGPAYHC